ncbi:MAG: helix-turn-helix domain-containing protein [Firmicutes bacterium]|nr:helix-turn-helix domain-containing protein [Bacillota bacterium]
MDCSKTGALIFKLRKEKGMTQRELAEKMNISDRTVSKWERGAGCPDVSLLHELSKILEVDVLKMLSGDLEENSINGGNMKKSKFYVCPQCKNVLLSSGESDISCCGRKLMPLMPKKTDDNHKINVEEIENDYFITIEHDMTKEHYIAFAAHVSYDRVLLIKMYPEQAAEIRIPKVRRGELYIYCSTHGLLDVGKL